MLEKGLKHTSRTVILPDNFALAMGSGDLPVLATPALVALMENAAMLAVAAELPEGATTVGDACSSFRWRGGSVCGSNTGRGGRTEVNLLAGRQGLGGCDRRRHAYPLYS